MQSVNTQQTTKPDSLTLNNKTILITGAAGFIGSNLVEYFATHHKDCKILALDYFRDSKTFPNGNPTTLGHFKNLSLYPNVEVLSLDIANEKELKSLQRDYGKIDYILHEAAVSDTTCMDMRHVMQVNFNAFKALIKLAMKHGAHIYTQVQPQSMVIQRFQIALGQMRFQKISMAFQSFAWIRKM